LAGDARAAVDAAAAYGYPVAVKIESRDILHKTEVQGVALGIKTPEAVAAAYSRLVDAAREREPHARVEGVIVQPMIAGDVELVIGVKRDPVFGTVVMVGAGGIYIEVLNDVVFRKAPVTVAEAHAMLGELRSARVLRGVRGKPPVDFDALARAVHAVSCFAAAAGDRLEELDLNPVICSSEHVTAVDWLVVVNDTQ
jgi:hypothetical protein